MMAAPQLEMRHITKRFPGVQALTDVSLEAYAGEALALIGANGAGKSTLMNVLGGVIRADEGEILLGGQSVEIHTPLDAVRHGVAFVHQEMAMLPTMTVAENIHITDFPTQAGLIRTSQMAEETEKVLDRLGCQFSAKTRVAELSAGDRQMVEIARALLGEPKVVIFDEPTSSLTAREKTRLFDVIRSLKKEGVTVIYITHFLDEVFQICERAMVMRGGEGVGSGLLTELTTADIVHMMIGDVEIQASAKPQPALDAPVVLRITELSRAGVLKDINLELHQGEVLGLWGLLGSGRTEVARSVVGLDPYDRGTIELRIDGSLKIVKGTEAQRWVGMVTEDRRNEGLLLPMSVKENISLANLRGLMNKWGLINQKREKQSAEQFVERLNIKISSMKQPVRTLSGGNQQKVVVGRWLELNPPIFIMDEPTRGLDVGAKAEIRKIIFELANSGASILVIDSEIVEMMALAGRYLVMNRGQIVAELPGDASKNDLMAAAAGVAQVEVAS
ncbi:MAG: sugar ABC transporter ATP-binding protein [Anaerolineae bacterium]